LRAGGLEDLPSDLPALKFTDFFLFFLLPAIIDIYISIKLKLYPYEKR